LNNSGAAYTLAQGSGGVIALDNGASAAAVTATGSHTISAPVTLTAQGANVTVAASSVLTMSGGISGSGATLTKSGNGTLTLSGAQTYATLSTSAGVTNAVSRLGTPTQTTVEPVLGTQLIDGASGTMAVNASGGTTNIAVNTNTNAQMPQAVSSLNVGSGAVVQLTAHTGGGTWTDQNGTVPAHVGALATASLGGAGMTTSGNTGTATGTIDITNQALVLTAANSTQQAANVTKAYALVTQGADGGDYLGNGITSSMAANDANNGAGIKGVMIYDNTQTGLQSIGGVDLTVDPNQNQVLIAYTLIGDFDYNGVVNAGDYGLLAYYQRNHLTALGDLDGNGVIDAGDYGLLAYVQRNQAADPLLQGSGAGTNSIQAVPEPTTNAFLLIGMGLFALGANVARRRKKHSV
jgi:hypothetical protein